MEIQNLINIKKTSLLDIVAINKDYAFFRLCFYACATFSLKKKRKKRNIKILFPIMQNQFSYKFCFRKKQKYSQQCHFLVPSIKCRHDNRRNRGLIWNLVAFQKLLPDKEEQPTACEILILLTQARYSHTEEFLMIGFFKISLEQRKNLAGMLNALVE